MIKLFFFFEELQLQFSFCLVSCVTIVLYIIIYKLTFLQELHYQFLIIEEDWSTIKLYVSL